MIEHSFTKEILNTLSKYYGEQAPAIYNASPLLGYINIKTKSANLGSKSRGSFANHYALYVIIEDYIKKGFFDGKAKKPYPKYEGARFTDLLERQRQLPFGSKLQNHGLNSRLNDEFRKYYPALDRQPIVRNVDTQRYWIHEDLLHVIIRHSDGKDHTYNIAPAVIDIIDAYVKVKKAAFESFLLVCNQTAEIAKKNPEQAKNFIIQQLQPSVDARIFEIISYAILKEKYGQETIWIGSKRETVSEKILELYKTGRTNANDGGIDFVMKPLGRFFQVTETVDMRKYFLDIDKVQQFPITFVIKSTDTEEKIRNTIRSQAISKYKIETIVDNYMNAIEEIITTPNLITALDTVANLGRLHTVMEVIIEQSKIEFNYIDDYEDDGDVEEI